MVWQKGDLVETENSVAERTKRRLRMVWRRGD